MVTQHAPDREGKLLYRTMRLRPLADYFLIACIVVVLAGLGVLMVTSSSMTWSVLEGASVFGTAARQAVMVALGFVAMWMCVRVRPETIRRAAPWVLGVSIVLLVLVLIDGIGTGLEEVGSQSWIVLGPLRLQPSELGKVAIAIWGSAFLTETAPSRRTGSLWESLTDTSAKRYGVFLGVAAVMLALILAEHDVGMALAFVVVVGVTLVFAGIDLRWIYSASAAFVVILLIMVKRASGFRSDRITVYKDAFFGHFEDTRGAAFQSYQGFLSLADGSVFGVGLGQSRAKWFYLPEAKNDFIFAIVGEEIGLFGGALVIVLYGALCFLGLRVARRSHNAFLSLLAATLTGSVTIQAFINIAYVIGLAPVTGIQLPLISAGGTSAVITLASMGLLANCARHEPEAVSAMQSYGRPWFDRWLMIPEPGVQPAGGHSATVRAGHPARRASSSAWMDDSRYGRDAESERFARRGGMRRGDALSAAAQRERTRRYGEPVTHLRSGRR